jgi:hypothetical protein
VRLAGIAVPDQHVLELALLLRKVGSDETAERLENAYDLETKILALTIAEREQIIQALDVPPDALAELRGVLLREHAWRVREGFSRDKFLSGNPAPLRLEAPCLSTGGAPCMPSS